MYSRYCDRRGWKMIGLSINESSAGGYKELILEVTGEGAYGDLKYESGVHRVQRVPDTESQGRVHTSAATVAVLPEADDDVAIEINETDLKIDTFRASGAGGQHVNKTESAIRITHMPSGIVVGCQMERSQMQNREVAMQMLRTKLYEAEVQKRHDVTASRRRTLVSTGDRSAKIRTYNYPQGRMTDHRIGLTIYNLAAIMDGDIQEIINQLQIAENAEKLKAGEDFDLD
jgi:peptide chain release factor 1